MSLESSLGLEDAVSHRSGGDAPVSTAPHDVAGLAADHDLRTSITALRLLVEAARDGIVEIGRGSAHLERIVVHTLLISEIAGEGRKRPGARWGAGGRATDLGVLIERWTDAMRYSAEAKEVELRVAIAADLPLIDCRPEHLSRVLLNLLDNAITHTPVGGVVVVSAGRLRRGVRVEVSDSGPGFSDAVRQRVRDDLRARSLTPAATQPPAAAVIAGSAQPPRAAGLVIADALIRAHGGLLWIGTPRRGASVHFSLPSGARRRPDPVA